MLTAVNVNKVFTQFLMLVLLCFIEAARTSLLNIINVFNYLQSLSIKLNSISIIINKFTIINQSKVSEIAF